MTRSVLATVSFRQNWYMRTRPSVFFSFFQKEEYQAFFAYLDAVHDGLESVDGPLELRLVPQAVVLHELEDGPEDGLDGAEAGALDELAEDLVGHEARVALVDRGNAHQVGGLAVAAVAFA